MAPPARQQPSRLRRLWAAAGTREWTGLARFAPHLQLVNLLLAATQLALGCYILGSLLEYGKWTETCYSPFAYDVDYEPHTFCPPFTMYTQDNQFTGAHKQWVGNFSALDSKGYAVVYALILPLSTLFMAVAAASAHFFPRVSLSLRMALYIGAWQAFDIVLYLYFTGSMLTVDWPFQQKGFVEGSMCFVHEDRGAAIGKLGLAREGSLSARRAVAIAAGCVAAFYLLLTILSIFQTYRRVRKAQHRRAADVRLQDLQASGTRRQGGGVDDSDAAATPLPACPLQSQRSVSTETRVRENDAFTGDGEDLGEPVRARDMV